MTEFIRIESAEPYFLRVSPAMLEILEKGWPLRVPPDHELTARHYTQDEVATETPPAIEFMPVHFNGTLERVKCVAGDYRRKLRSRVFVIASAYLPLDEYDKFERRGHIWRDEKPWLR